MSFLIITAIAAAIALPHVYAYGRDRDGRWHQYRFGRDRRLAPDGEWQYRDVHPSDDDDDAATRCW